MAPTKITFKLVESDKELASALGLRRAVYCEEYHHLDAEDYPDGQERDRWDGSSVHFVALIDDEVIATVRLIRDSKLGFQTEQYVNLPRGVSREKIAEVSRLTLKKDFRGHGDHIILGLSKLMYRYSRECRITYWFATMFTPTWKLFLRYGIYFRVAGDLSLWPPTPGKGKPVIPVVLDLNEAGLYLLHHNESLFREVYGDPRDYRPAQSRSELDKVLASLQRDLTFVKQRPVCM